MNGVTYEFFKVILLGQNLMETALSLDQRIKPARFTYQNDCGVVRIYIDPVTWQSRNIIQKSLYLGWL
jgi:hypothetical protein